MAGNILKKYLWVLDKLMNHGALSFEQLNSYWVRSEISEGKPLSKRTFQNFKDGIFDVFEIEIVCEKSGDYRYSLGSGNKRVNNAFVESILIQNHILNSPTLRNNVLNCDYGLQEVLLYFMNLIENRIVISFIFSHIEISDNPDDDCACKIHHFLPVSLVKAYGDWFVIGVFVSDYGTLKIKGTFAQYIMEILVGVKEEYKYEGEEIPFDLQQYVENFSLKNIKYSPIPESSCEVFDNLFFDDSKKFLKQLWYSRYYYIRGDLFVGSHVYDSLKERDPEMYNSAMDRIKNKSHKYLGNLDDWMKR